MCRVKKRYSHMYCSKNAIYIHAAVWNPSCSFTHRKFACFPINDTIFPSFRFEWLWIWCRNFPEGCFVRNRKTEHLHTLKRSVFYFIVTPHYNYKRKYWSIHCCNDCVASHDSFATVLACMHELPMALVVVKLWLYWFSSGALVASCKQWRKNEAKP